uniref:Uncharacterized protein n=1 Tax=Bionectria ochroleuca TaxID=29856 RepID=A0A8H7NLC1_BIOOC
MLPWPPHALASFISLNVATCTFRDEGKRAPSPPAQARQKMPNIKLIRVAKLRLLRCQAVPPGTEQRHWHKAICKVADWHRTGDHHEYASRGFVVAKWATSA